jgi:hypothetical protein
MVFQHPFSKFFIRQGYPDFLDLPWEYPLTDWKDHYPRYIEVDKEISCLIVVFVSYRDTTFAIK